MDALWRLLGCGTRFFAGKYKRHTCAPVVDIATAIPRLAILARATVRLHPRRGECSADQSKIGGTCLWPADEEWPSCSEHHCPLVTVLQLRREDVPEMVFPHEANLFQLLWCPNDHQPQCSPAPRVFWRRQEEMHNHRSSFPAPGPAEEGYSPEACVLFPERVIEYPHASEVCDRFPDLWAEIGSSTLLANAIKSITGDGFKGPDTLYQYWLSVAYGTKVGGYPHWNQDPQWPKCNCRADMEYLLTIASAEFDGGSWGRWLAQEDQRVWGASYEKRKAVQFPANLMLGDMGNMNLFICRQCHDWPIASVFQCS